MTHKHDAPQNGPTITQADRDAAGNLYSRLFPSDDLRGINVKLGNIDDGHAVQAFAAHREAAERSTIEKVAEWLRDVIDLQDNDYSGWNAMFLANAIERGEWK